MYNKVNTLLYTIINTERNRKITSHDQISFTSPLTDDSVLYRRFPLQ